MDDRNSLSARRDREPRGRTRRRLLGGIGATVGIASLSTIAGARRRQSTTESGRGDRADRKRDHRSNSDPYERSLFLRERAGWSNARWRAYLSKRGIGHGTLERRYAVPSADTSVDRNETETDDRVTTEKFDRYELTLYVTYSRPWYVGYDVIDLEWEFTDQELDDFAQSPADNAAISFRPAHYTPTNARRQWVYYGGNCSDPDGIDSKTPGGALCEWRDIGDRDDRSHFGVYVEPNWQEYDEWERRVYVDFVHTWSGYGLTSVSVGLGGISMGFSRNTDRWDREESTVEARLLEGERTTG